MIYKILFHVVSVVVLYVQWIMKFRAITIRSPGLGFVFSSLNHCYVKGMCSCNFAQAKNLNLLWSSFLALYHLNDLWPIFGLYNNLDQKCVQFGLRFCEIKKSEKMLTYMRFSFILGSCCLYLSSGSVNVFVVLQMQPLTNYTGLLIITLNSWVLTAFLCSCTKHYIKSFMVLWL